MSEQRTWNEVINGSQSENLLRAAMHHAACGLSEMVGRPIEVDIPRIETVPISRVATRVGGPEVEMVGVYLLLDGNLQGQAVLMLPISDALYLVDLLMGASPGETTALDDLERSALAEVGNLTLSAFLDELAALTGIPVRPSPPAVVVDMLGAILNVVASSVAVVSDELVIIETDFKDPERSVQVRFWVLPDPTYLTRDSLQVHQTENWPPGRGESNFRLPLKRTP